MPLQSTNSSYLHTFHCLHFISQHTSFQTVHISTQFLRHSSDSASSLLRYTTPPLPSTVHRLLAKLKLGPEYAKFMALEAPNATTTANEATYCGSEAAYPIAASFLDTAILSLTMPVLKEGYTRKSKGGTPPPTHTHTLE